MQWKFEGPPSATALITVTAAQEVLSWSAGAQQLFGYSADEVARRTLRSLVTPGVTDFEERLRDAGRFISIATCHRKDGSHAAVELSVERLAPCHEGAAGEYLCFVRDLTLHDDPRRAALDHARLRGLINRMNEVELVVRPADGRIVVANDRATELYGYSHDELCALTVFELRGAGQAEHVRQQVNEALLHGIRFQTTHLKKDGSTIPVAVSSRGFTIDGVPYLHSLVQDLTHAMALADERERSERRYHALFEHLGEELSVFEVVRDEDGTWDWILRASNELGRQWFQGRYEQAIGRRLRTMSADSSMLEHVDRTSALLLGDHFVTETYVPLRDRWYRSASFAIDEKTVASSAFDITALRRTQRELEAATASARAANALKSQFLANMSHEIRTPLNAVLGLARLAIDETSPEKTREYLSHIHRAGSGLLELINDILDFSKIEAGRLSVERAPFRLERLLQDVHDTLEPAADSRGLSLQLAIDLAVPRVVVGDVLRVRQVLTNLVSNALKFTHQGRVRVDVTLDETQAVRITVTDTGIGVAPEAVPHLFETFMQADASTSRRFGGTGLGLAISRQLARLMGGDLRHFTPPTHGAGFVFDTALRAASAAEQKTLETGESTEHLVSVPEVLAGRNVLLVEDNKVNQLLASTLLKKAAMNVTIANHGQEALDALHGPSGGFDVVLMDLQMPVMDGLEATRRARQTLGLRCPPIIAMTANAMPEDAVRTAEAGMRAHLTKPIDVARLYSVLAGLLAA